MGKIYLLQAAAEAQLWTLAVVLVLTTVVSYWYYLRVAWFMWMREAPEGSEMVVVTPLALRVALIAAVGLILLTGVFPGATLDLAAGSVEGLRQLVVESAALP